MKIVFSRKGFDSASGGVPSPIIDGRPISLPIPTQRRSETTYGGLGLGDIVAKVSKGRLSADSLCHNDPMFEGGRCAFGQTGAAQAHLANNGVKEGDVFLFFGLFSELGGNDRHHRIFGYLLVEELISLDSTPGIGDQPQGFSARHPHTIGEWNPNNSLYVGSGTVSNRADDALRLSRPNGVVSRWRVPPWLRATGLTYHRRNDRWEDPGTLIVAGRGQEFVCDISGRLDAKDWLDGILSAIERETTFTRRN
jgi:hypothetical protein